MDSLLTTPEFGLSAMTLHSKVLPQEAFQFHGILSISAIQRIMDLGWLLLHRDFHCYSTYIVYLFLAIQSAGH